MIKISQDFEENPDILKIANVVPIFKYGNSSDPTNYRPISCLPYLGKVIEKCVSTRIVSFCKKFNIFSDSQFGFLKGKSTCDALLDLTEFIFHSLDKKQYNVTILVDLKKAFDTVNHDILIQKLERYGFRGSFLGWLKSYVSNRRCYVEIEGIKSGERVLDVGIQQSSILGPILFLLYVNDLPLVSKSFKTTLFADDTTFTNSHTNLDVLLSNSNTELVKIHDWTVSNRLTINTDKTETLLVTNRTYDHDQIKIQLNNKEIKLVDSCKFLGINIDSKFTFKNHIQLVLGKISKHSGILYRIRNKLTKKARLDYYYAMIYPYLSYNVCVWGSTNPTHLAPIVTLQKKIVRNIVNASFNDHSSPHFHRLALLKFPDIHRFFVLIRMFKLVKKGEFSINHDVNTRNRNLTAPTFHRLSLSQHSFSFVGPKLWNGLPQNLREISNETKFRRCLKIYLLEQYIN